MTVLDIHTHHPDDTQAIISVNPGEFRPAPGRLYSVGIHPWHSEQCDTHAIDALNAAARHPQVAALGETGLDTLRGAPIARQTQLLLHHLELAQATGKPIVVHCVRAWQPLIAACRKARVGQGRIAIHGFRGNANVARTLVDEGFYLSFGLHFNPSALTVTPLDRILIETDDEPVSIGLVAQHVAAALSMPTEQLIAHARANAATFLT
ncbi:MAG: TatD family hydrolase [Muribaculaceae bacterium]|nr:TatD family hydrolase [Muribaculaceae bacterium]